MFTFPLLRGFFHQTSYSDVGEARITYVTLENSVMLRIRMLLSMDAEAEPMSSNLDRALCRVLRGCSFGIFFLILLTNRG
jgi:hypothetical protein